MTAASIFALLCGFLALAYGVWSVKWILALPDGNDRMREIAALMMAILLAGRVITPWARVQAAR